MISPPTTAARRATSARLSLFIPSLHGGGAERVMVSLANGLAAKGLDVDLVLARKEGVYLADVSPDVRIVSLNAPRTRQTLWHLVHNLRRERTANPVSALHSANTLARMTFRIPN